MTKAVVSQAWRCRLGIHKWTVTEHSREHPDIAVRRKCTLCGKKELNVWGHWCKE